MLTEAEKLSILAGKPISVTGNDGQTVVTDEDGSVESGTTVTITNSNGNLNGSQKVGSVARLIAMLIAIVNQIAVSLGLYTIPDVDEGTIQLISLGLVIITSIWGYWKNNSWTPEAKLADKVLEAVRDGDLDVSEILTILANIANKKKDK